MCQKPLEHSTGADQAEVKEREEAGQGDRRSERNRGREEERREEKE